MSELEPLSLDDDDVDVEEPAESPREQRASSLIGKLRARSEDRLDARTLDVAVPGWDREGYGLVVRCRALRWSELGPLVHRQLDAKRGNKAREDVRTACDVLIRACVDIRISLPGDAGTVPLDEAPGAEPCRFDSRTCTLLELAPPANAREALVAVFRDWDVAVVAANGEYQEWVGGQSVELEETGRALGET